MTTRKQLTRTLEEAQSLLHGLIQNGGGRLDALYRQIDVLQDVALHVEYELTHGEDRAQKTRNQSRKAA